VATFKTMAVVCGMLLSTLMIGASGQGCSVYAQDSCAASCRAAYGSCYKSTANRAACEGLLQRCLQNCISPKR
jgi:hypothetical protein